ncbi:something about silencing protein 10 [Malassezia sp. CBS 17886]|nr:something about silencing protein 10 [Malassezia sp. CBS 17886]
MGDVDRFDAARDEILLDDSGRGDDSDEDFGAQEAEVLGWDTKDEKGGALELSDAEAEGAEDDTDAAHGADAGGNADDERYRTMYAPPPQTGNRRAPRDAAHEEEADVETDSELEEDSGWGANKRSYYSGNTAEDMESDSDMDEAKAHELETNEAVRLQRLSRSGMADDDFGLDTIDMAAAQAGADEQSAAARAKRRRELDAGAADEVPEHLGAAAMHAHLQVHSPIVLALADEYQDVVGELAPTWSYAERVSQHGGRQIAEIAHLYYQTLSSYAMLIAFFFQLAATKSMAAHPEALQGHPVMARLSQFKKALVEMKTLGLFDPDASDGASDDASDEMVGIFGPPTEEDLAYEPQGSLEPNELEDLLRDAEHPRDAPGYAAQAEPPAPAGDTVRAAPRKPKGKTPREKRAARTAAPGGLLADVAHVHAGDVLPAKRVRRNGAGERALDADAFGEPEQLGVGDRLEKAARKRAVQFHAEGAPTAHREAHALDGDMDIPYRDRRRSRDAVAVAKTSREGRAPQDTSLGAGDWSERDWHDRAEVMHEAHDADGDGADAYYDLVSSGRRARKAEKKAAHDRQREAERVVDDDVLAPGEHRTIDRTIEKNRGLTPSRARSIRNPRVKRRRRFDRAQKRLSSTRAVYKGGQGALTGGYAGEKSGISTNLVKSRKLGG